MPVWASIDEVHTCAWNFGSSGLKSALSVLVGEVCAGGALSRGPPAWPPPDGSIAVHSGTALASVLSATASRFEKLSRSWCACTRTGWVDIGNAGETLSGT